MKADKRRLIEFTLEKRVDTLVNPGYVSWFIDGETPGKKVVSKLMPGVTYGEDHNLFCFDNGATDAIVLFFGEFSLSVPPLYMRANDTPVFVAKSLYQLIKKSRAWTKRCEKTGGIVEVEEVADGEGFSVIVTVNNERKQETNW